MTQNLLQELTKLISNSEVYNSPDGILKNKLIEDGFKNDPTLISLLLSNTSLKTHFFTELDSGILVFNSLKFQQFLSLKDFLPDSYTSFKNKIGLTDDGDYLSQNKNVVLDFPFKDCVLEGGQSKDDTKRKEIFQNETLAPDEIDVLLEPKILTNTKKYTTNGIEQVIEFNRNEQGVITDNLIIKGNNLIALHSLKKEFKGKVKLIYIDPPYNTGNDSFGYNDKFNHSTWLVFMKNRLEVARELLRDDGVIFVQCDDNEQAYLKVLMDEIFENSNFLNTVCVKMKQSSGASGGGEDKKLKKNIEFINIFCKNKNHFGSFNEVSEEEELFSLINSMKNEGKSWKYTRVLFGIEKREFYKEIFDGSGEIIRIFRHDQTVIKTISELMKEDKLTAEKCYLKYFNKIFRDTNAQSSIRTKVMEATKENGDFFSIDYIPKSGKNKKTITTLYYKGNNRDLIAWLKDVCIERNNKIYKLDKAGTFWDGINLNNLTKEGDTVFESGKKPEELIKRIIEMVTHEDDVILDYHLGSGTTAAVAHKMGRQYIGVEQMDYIETISVERMKKVIGVEATTASLLGIKETKIENFDNGGISKAINWQGGGEFVYCELKQHNQAFVERVQKAENQAEIKSIWQDIQQSGFLSYKTDLKSVDRNSSEFDNLSLEDRQRFLMEILDKNMLYVNYSDIDNRDYPVTEEEKVVNKSFYKGKK